MSTTISCSCVVIIFTNCPTVEAKGPEKSITYSSLATRLVRCRAWLMVTRLVTSDHCASCELLLHRHLEVETIATSNIMQGAMLGLNYHSEVQAVKILVAIKVGCVMQRQTLDFCLRNHVRKHAFKHVGPSGAVQTVSDSRRPLFLLQTITPLNRNITPLNRHITPLNRNITPLQPEYNPAPTGI